MGYSLAGQKPDKPEKPSLAVGQYLYEMLTVAVYFLATIQGGDAVRWRGEKARLWT